jgi:hypothetical protein
MINSRIRFIFTCSRCLPKCLTVGLWLFHTLMERKSKGLSIVSTIMADLPPDIEMQVLLCTVGDQTKWRLLYHREKIGLFRVTLQRPFSVSLFPFVYMIRPHLFSMCTAFAIVFPHLIPLKLLRRETWFWPETLVSTKKEPTLYLFFPPSV